MHKHPAFLGEVPPGAAVLEPDSGMRFLVADQKHPGHPGTTLITEKVVDIACFDAREPERPIKDGKSYHIFEQSYRFGLNDYGKSNIRQWLESDQENWYTPQHDLDCPPDIDHTLYHEWGYADRPGFLTLFPKAFRDALQPVDVAYLVRDRRDEGHIAHLTAKVFLPSRTELCKGSDFGLDEGAPMPIFYDPHFFKPYPTQELRDKYGREINPERETAHYGAPQIYDPIYGWWYWMRGANLGYSFLNRVASPYGAVSYTYSASDVVGVRPVLVLPEEVEVTGDGKYQETFTLKLKH